MSKEKDSIQNQKQQTHSLGSLYQKCKNNNILLPKMPIKYQIVSKTYQPNQKILLKEDQRQINTQDKITEPSYQNDELQNLANKTVNSDQLWDSVSQCSSQSSLISKLTITNDKIEYKIIIVGNQKYQIIQNHKQNPSQSNFKKIPTKTQQQTSQPKQTSKIQTTELKQIPIEKFFIQNNSWDQLDQINKSDPGNQKTYMVFRQILNSEKIKINEQSHAEIKTKIISESQKYSNSYFTILLALQEYLKCIHPSIKVIFCQKSSLKTQVSIKIISTGFAFQKFKCSHQIKKKYQFLTFESIIGSQKIFDKFQDWYSDYFSTQFLQGKPINIKLTSISKLIQGDLCVQWDTYQPEIIIRNPKALKRIKVTPYFQKFYLSIEDFDTSRGNIKFPQIQKLIDRRGNYPYFPPQKCTRYSIKVWNKFDSGNNQWLFMNNNKNQWPSAFFGLFNPKLVNLDNNSIDLNLSIQTRAEDFQPIIQLKNTLKNTVSLNTNQTIGQGIICTPYMYYALKDSQQVQVNGQKYVLVFQCRLNPKKLKITKKEEYWMVNQFSDVRPYGIILMPKQVKKVYPIPQNRFSSTFSYIQLKKFLKNKLDSLSLTQ